MANTIIIKNGSSAPSSILNSAELGYDTSGKKLYAGNGVGVEETCINPLDIDISDSKSGSASSINADTLNGKAASEYASVNMGVKISPLDGDFMSF